MKNKKLLIIVAIAIVSVAAIAVVQMCNNRATGFSYDPVTQVVTISKRDDFGEDSVIILTSDGRIVHKEIHLQPTGSDAPYIEGEVLAETSITEAKYRLILRQIKSVKNTDEEDVPKLGNSSVRFVIAIEESSYLFTPHPDLESSTVYALYKELYLCLYPDV